MTNTSDLTPNSRFIVLAGAGLAAFLLPTIAAAQSTSETTSIFGGMTVPLVAPGTPAGSFALSGFETVNLYSGKLNVRIPLMNVGGRGEAGYTMFLPVQRNWEIEKTVDGSLYSYFATT